VPIHKRSQEDEGRHETDGTVSRPFVRSRWEDQNRPERGAGSRRDATYSNTTTSDI
jgi:hypothetical protein